MHLRAGRGGLAREGRAGLMRSFCGSICLFSPRQQDCHDLDSCVHVYGGVSACLSCGIFVALERLNAIMRHDFRF